jgi:hypothetical protein
MRKIMRPSIKEGAGLAAMVLLAAICINVSFAVAYSSTNGVFKITDDNPAPEPTTLLKITDDNPTPEPTTFLFFDSGFRTM